MHLSPFPVTYSNNTLTDCRQY